MRNKDNLVYFPLLVESCKENESLWRHYAQIIEERILQEKMREAKEPSRVLSVQQERMTYSFLDSYINYSLNYCGKDK